MESREELFLKYDYPETKDMCKQFLTLVSSLLVVSLTFSDKIANFSKAPQLIKWLIIWSWISFLIAIISCGLGLLQVVKAAGDARYVQHEFLDLAAKANKKIIVAGGCFIIGLSLLILSAVMSL